MSNQPLASMETRVAKLEGQLSQLVKSVSSFIESSENWRTDVSKSLAKLSENLAEKTRPNINTMAVWAGLVLAVIGFISSPCGFFIIREFNRQDKVSENLDIKLQREFTLMQLNTEQKVAGVDKASLERHEEVMRGLVALESWRVESTKLDLEELHQRRLRDIEHK